MSRKDKSRALYQPALALAGRLGATDREIWTKELPGDWAVAVNTTDKQKRAQMGPLGMGVMLAPRGVALWNKGWLVAVLMEQGGTFAPRDEATTMGSALQALNDALKQVH